MPLQRKPDKRYGIHHMTGHQSCVAIKSDYSVRKAIGDHGCPTKPMRDIRRSIRVGSDEFMDPW